MSTAVDPEQLLADAAWLRRLALRLAADPDDADDLVQESQIAAWQRQPDAGRSLRPWLAKVVRDLAAMKRRGDHRRTAREQAVVGDAETPPDTLLEQVRLHRLLVDLVLELDEPYRSTILARYVEGKPAAEIARSLGIPESTVRGRLRDGLARLRARLDDKTGERKAWAPAVLAFAHKGVGVAKSTKSIAIIVALLALLVGGLVGLVHVLRRPDPATPAPAGAVDPRTGLPRAGADAGGVPSWFGQTGVAGSAIRGRVTFEGKPVAGAIVALHGMLTDAGTAPLTVRTGADGRFDLGVHPAAGFDVTASAPDRTSAVVKVNLANPVGRPRPDQLELRLGACDAAVTGSIVDAGGNPIPRARVSRERRAAIDADDRGGYRICVPRGQVAVQFEADGYGSVTLTVFVQGVAHQDVVLVPEGTLTVRAVRADDGRPVAGAYINVFPRDWGPDRASAMHAVTDPDGVARVASLLPGTYELLGFGDGIGTPAPVEVVVGVGAAPDAVVRLEGVARIRGKVLSGTTPIAGVEVRALRRTPMGPSDVGYSQTDGTFALDRVLLGDLSFVAAPYQVVSPTTFHIDTGTTHDVVLQVAKLGSITGRITRHGAPVAGAVVCCARDVRGGEGEATSDADGRYELRGLAAGSYDISAQTSEAFHPPAPVALADAEDRTFDVELDLGGMITGTVVDQDGKPVRGVWVQWLRAGDQGTCNTDDHGRYRCGALAGGGAYQAGVYPTSALQKSFATADGAAHPAITVADGKTVVDGVTLAIDHQARTIAGRVVDDTGAPVADARVTALPAVDGRPPLFHSWLRLPTTFTDEHGEFVLGELVTGTYAVKARATDGGEGIVAGAAAGSSGIKIRLVRPATIQGTLTGFTATPMVYARPIGGGYEPGLAVVDGTAFRFAALAPGRYVIDGQSQSEGDAKVVELRAGETATVALTARGRAAIEVAVLELGSRKPVAAVQCHAVLSVDGELGITNWDLPGDPRTGADGRLVLDPAPAGSVDVTCIMPAPRWSPPAGHVDVAAGERGRLELFTVEVTTSVQADIGVAFDSHVTPPRIAGVRAGSTAAAAGLAAGDLITAIDGTAVAGVNAQGVRALIANHPIGSDVAVTFTRGSTTRTVTAKAEQAD